MSRLAIPTLAAAPAAARPLLDAVGAQLGSVPNLFRLLAQSPAALEGTLALSKAAHRTLDLKLRERIALAVAEVNGCDYCLSAHAALAAGMAKLDPQEIALARRGHAGEPRADAAVVFARRIAETRGRVADEDLAALRGAGFTEAQTIEIVLVVAENFLTNLVNNVAETAIDFPVLRTGEG